MNFNITALHYYEQNTGILLYSTVRIKEEEIGDPSTWFNHSFTRTLIDYPDFSEKLEDDEGDKSIPKVTVDVFFVLGSGCWNTGG